MVAEKRKSVLERFRAHNKASPEMIDLKGIARDEVIFLRVHRVSAVKRPFETFARAETILQDTDRLQICATTSAAALALHLSGTLLSETYKPEDPNAWISYFYDRLRHT